MVYSVQDWVDDLDSLGALAGKNELRAHLECVPPGVDPELLAFVQSCLHWPPKYYMPSRLAAEFMALID